MRTAFKIAIGIVAVLAFFVVVGTMFGDKYNSTNSIAPQDVRCFDSIDYEGKHISTFKENNVLPQNCNLMTQAPLNINNLNNGGLTQQLDNYEWEGGLYSNIEIVLLNGTTIEETYTGAGARVVITTTYTPPPKPALPGINSTIFKTFTPPTETTPVVITKIENDPEPFRFPAIPPKKVEPQYEITYAENEENQGREEDWKVISEDRDEAPYTNIEAFNPNLGSIRDLEQDLHELINDYRQENGLDKIRFNNDLADIARSHSEEQVAYRYISHINNAGEDFEDRYANAGYECEIIYDEDDKYVYYLTGGENTLYHFTNEYYYEDGTVSEEDWFTQKEMVEDMFTGWKESPGHNENMLEGLWNKGGIGIAINQHAEIVATQNFC